MELIPFLKILGELLAPELMNKAGLFSECFMRKGKMMYTVEHTVEN